LRTQQCHADEFVIIDNNGFHEVGVDFCACGNTLATHVDQLLQARLFPATVSEPRTALTFNTLKTFELLSYESKASVFEFYSTLSRLTDNTGTRRPKVRITNFRLGLVFVDKYAEKDRYPIFLRVVREWRHLKMMKRAGRGHDPGGIAATALGECALLCPACPHLGKNMAPGWEDAPENERYMLACPLDCRFH
jgi:hypothetical protein